MKKLYTDKSHINGNGLFVSEALIEGETVAYIHGPTKVIKHFTDDLAQSTVNWIGVGRYTWIDTSKSPFRFINHSCDPNVAVVTKRKVIALKSIPADTELTMDYSLTEAEEAWTIEQCTCETTRCRGKITAIQFLPQSTFTRLESHIPKNFIRLYKAEQKLK